MALKLTIMSVLYVIISIVFNYNYSRRWFPQHLWFDNEEAHKNVLEIVKSHISLTIFFLRIYRYGVHNARKLSFTFLK